MGLGIQLMLLAGVCVAISNFCMRKGVDAGGTSKAFLMVQLFLTFIVAILLNPVRSGDYSWSLSMGCFGLAGGLVLAFMMYSLGKAVESGPAALSFAMLSSATVMPILFMVILFGASFGFAYNMFNAAGSLLVVTGILWAGWESFSVADKRKWLLFAVLAFFLHAVFLVFMQWRALLINFPGHGGLYLSFDSQAAKSQWFMPMVFFAASLIQVIIYIISQKKWPSTVEVVDGTLGGVANGIGTFLMIRSTEVSTPVEHAMIFPLFAVSIMVSCNIWGQAIYKEKINWKATAFCVFGVLIGTLDWNVLLASQ
jgi:drug/metabolite transporter (DMT)-like permease